MKKTKLISLLFCVTGIIVIGYSFVINTFFENLDLGKRFHASEFRESDLYIWMGFIWIFFGLIYFIFYRMDKFQLKDKLSRMHYWFTLLFVIELMFVPIQNRYYPTDVYRGTLLMKIFDGFLAISFMLFVIGLFGFVANLINSGYAYFLIKKGWEN